MKNSNYLKSTNLFLFSLLIFLINASYGQVLYDNGPIYTGNKFNAQGNKWSNNNLSYYIENGTNDILGDAENLAITEAFAIWSCYTPLTFTEVNSPFNADIIILWGENNHGDGFPFDGVSGVLAHAFYPPPNSGSLAGDIHFDDSETWTTEIRPNSTQPIDLITVAAHEIGHSLGLAHSDDANAIMYSFYNGSHRFLDNDDILGIQAIYGMNTNGENVLTDVDFLCSFDNTDVAFLDNCNSGATVLNWQVSTNVQINSSNSSSVNISRNPGSYSEGLAWVEANLSNGSVIRDDFWIGRPNSNGLNFISSGNFDISTNRWYAFTANHQNQSPVAHNA